MSASLLVVWFADIDIHETSSIGKKGKHFGQLAQAGFPMLPGFVITQDAYFAFLKENHLDTKIERLLSTIDHRKLESMHQVLHHIKDLIDQAPMPESIIKTLAKYYDAVDGYPLTLHTYATTEHAQKVVTHQANEYEELLEAIKQSWIEQFDPNIHWKRQIHGHHHTASGVEVIVQVDIEPDKKGKIHTVDPHEHVKNVIMITHDHPHASDTYTLSKNTLTIIDRHLTHYNSAPKLTLDELLDLGDLGRDLENFLYFPQEITWGIYGDALYLLGSKPLSTLPKAKPEKKKKLPHGRATSLTHTINTGVIRIIHESKDLQQVTIDDIVVLHDVEKSHLKHLKKAKGIISETGSRHSEISVLLKQLGIPVMYNVKDATKRFKTGRVITLNGLKGEIYLGGFH